MASGAALQLIIVPHRPLSSDDEINRDLAPGFHILQQATGLKAIWRGKKFEDRYTQVAIVLWDNLAASHVFFTSPAYFQFHQAIQPAMNGRHIEWQNHALVNVTGEDTMSHLADTLHSPAIEVALTKVVEGGVAGYYNQFKAVVASVLQSEDGCDAYFISPLIENPENQLLLINWKSVDIFEKTPGFKACIDALKDYYATFVVPWHITELKLEYGGI
ncbi:hypothetical protein SCUP234_12817 [Seiridium cupressi]